MSLIMSPYRIWVRISYKITLLLFAAIGLAIVQSCVLQAYAIRWLHSGELCLQNWALSCCTDWWNTSWHPVACIRAHIFVAGTVSVLHRSEWEKEVAPAPLFSSLRGIFVFVPKHCGVQWQISVYKTTQPLTMTEEFIPPPLHSYTDMYVKLVELTSRLSYREVF